MERTVCRGNSEGGGTVCRGSGVCGGNGELREPSVERTVCRENSVLMERYVEVIACEGNYNTVCAGLCIVHWKQGIKFEGVYKLLLCAGWPRGQVLPSTR